MHVISSIVIIIIIILLLLYHDCEYDTCDIAVCFCVKESVAHLNLLEYLSFEFPICITNNKQTNNVLDFVLEKSRLYSSHQHVCSLNSLTHCSLLTTHWSHMCDKQFI